MTRGYKLVASVFAVTMVAGLGVFQSQASADVLSCPQQNGTVRVWDREVNRCGILSVNNSDWRLIGNPPWDNRIDGFGNDDFIQNRTMCLYDGYSFTGAKVALPPGFAVTWNNTVSSNRWTTGSC